MHQRSGVEPQSTSRLPMTPHAHPFLSHTTYARGQQRSRRLVPKSLSAGGPGSITPFRITGGSATASCAEPNCTWRRASALRALQGYTDVFDTRDYRPGVSARLLILPPKRGGGAGLDKRRVFPTPSLLDQSGSPHLPRRFQTDPEGSRTPSPKRSSFSF